MRWIKSFLIVSSWIFFFNLSSWCRPEYYPTWRRTQRSSRIKGDLRNCFRNNWFVISRFQVRVRAGAPKISIKNFIINKKTISICVSGFVLIYGESLHSKDFSDTTGTRQRLQCICSACLMFFCFLKAKF